VGFAAWGAKRGLLRALAGLLIVVMALVGAGIIAATFTDPAVKLVSPLIEKRISAKVDDALAQQTPQVSEETDEDSQIEELLSLLGLDHDVRSSLAERTAETVRDTGVTIAVAVVESVARSMIYGFLYILSFIALLVLLNVLVRAMDLMLKLPGLHGLNAVGGGILGLAEGVLVLFLAVWALRRLGVSFDADPWAQAQVLRIFTANTPLSVLSFLQ
jgi:hypothetical protein